MIPEKIAGANRTFGAPADWDPDRDGPCAALAVEYTGQMLRSAWMPDAAELAALNAGMPVVLMIWGRSHPVVSVGVQRVEAELRKYTDVLEKIFDDLERARAQLKVKP